MAGKRVRSDDDLNGCQQIRSVRGRNEHLSLTEQLQEDIDQQIEVLGGDYRNFDMVLQSLDLPEEIDEPSSPNICERLEEIIQMQNLDFERRSNILQTGDGEINNSAEQVPDNPLDLSQNDLDTLRCTGGNVADYTIVPRPFFNGLEIHRNMNLREIASTDLAAYTIFVQDALSEIVSFSRQLGGEGSFINISLRGPSLKSDVNALLRPGNDDDERHFVDQFESVVQSNAQVMVDDSLQLHVSIARSRQGGGTRRKITDIAHDEVLKRKRMNLFSPCNMTNNLCFAICLAHFLDPLAEHAVLESRACDIQTAAGLTSQECVGYNHVACFEQPLGLKIVVFTRASGGKLEMYKTHDEPHDKTVFLYLHDGHYHMIEYVEAFLGYPYVCSYCYKGFTNRLNHDCAYNCSVCNDIQCYKQIKRSIHCPDCLRFCKSEYCFNAHKRVSGDGSGRSACDTTKYCSKCGRRYHVATIQNKPHKCPALCCFYCSVDISHEGSHECFIQPVPFKVIKDKYIFYDFETSCDAGKHIANYVCAMTFRGKAFEWGGENCIKQFVQQFRRPKYKNYTFVAHNGAGFDNFLILEYFCKEGLLLNIVMQGCRLTFMYDESFKQRYIDSFSFMPMALAKTPAAFNLLNTEKGYFPHFFNRTENQCYQGPYPAKHYYGYTTMSDSARVKFDQWYDTRKGKIFDFKKEIGLYCMNDVVLLREACITYRKEFIECTQVDPFSFTTLASCCMGVFKSHFLTPNTIALTHNNAYIHQHKTFSNVSIEWLEYVKKTRDVDIHHALTHGEMQFGSFYVDGYYEQSGVRKALDFAGCYFHGHGECYRSDDINPQSKLPYGIHLKMFNDRLEVLRKSYNLVVEVMWECRWRELKRTDADVIHFMSTYSAPERLKPRDSLFGGRTNSYKLFHKAGEGEKIRYVDFTSLYPFVQSRRPYPLGHPEIIFKDFQKIENYFGLVKAKVLPPRGLLHPVLPYRCQGKLMFPLCRTCAEELSKVMPCTHTDEERSISGTWVSLELLKAIEKNYVVLKIFEVWHFPQKSDSLFGGYVKTFLRFKQQASGYPSHVTTEEDKQAYIDDYHQKEGIQLDRQKICHNPAQRSINKLLLNSLWGRFSLRENMPNCKLLQSASDFSQFIFGCKYEVKYFMFVSDEVALVQYRHVEGSVYETRDVNVFIGAFTTAHARLELYNLMDRLGDRLLYSDTDSVIYVSRDGDWEPPLGPYLGDLTNELDSDDFIIEVASGGPKTYGYRTYKGKVTMKAKGITLNSENSKVITLDSLIGLVDSYVTSSDSNQHLLAHTDSIVRNKKNFTLRNKSVVKRFKVVYNKRQLLPDYTTLPYGY
ncbi:uncharacterized protein LOC130431856 isoform X1 [Triplophysa dalaica]|uniref:uncharacterized protein LOC130410589 n=1 Tax=Triplophysa dalaica TaxID=1582913 RepID=UPI0024DF7C60|nr:uncharacterized protein LOC130410589 [Triplophysa dalaica]XP_056591325.1 uncharacterized protein LOC130410589 [Triplophysa dalaica]XP_056591326.1 uncharacterized protein LOC130410589 [Triplophysa dalaica]XP_056604662.1 uncharacterized protein LOC130421034 [Triplophysa dalaica]XP_056604663.1 uncharacterized protein LOC130421034 [Triplophysa dalaica]XP_056604664.1 uncharacterized protein LOC130421034 [Triplophysa dalaica]XP_056604665.1 uncharacterized protein LOC130421034 [Triplophysa dalaic